jgi:hypothetical protein
MYNLKNLVSNLNISRVMQVVSFTKGGYLTRLISSHFILSGNYRFRLILHPSKDPSINFKATRGDSGIARHIIYRHRDDILPGAKRQVLAQYIPGIHIAGHID